MLLVTKEITKRYSNHVALDKVSIEVEPQSIFGLLGPNGAGKTSLIRIINQITAPDEGTVFFNNEKLSPLHTAQIGYLPEERGLYKKMKVGEQAIYLAQLKGMPKEKAMNELKIWFEKFDIKSWWNKNVEELSKGMQQKIQFIVTIIHKPKLLIFDEPFSGFDPINVNLLKNEIIDLQQNGATIIFSTHNMSSVEELCDNIALINKSKTILSGSVHEIKNKFKSNLFTVKYSDINVDLKELLPDVFSIIDCKIDKYETTATIRLPKNSSQKDLIQLLIDQVNIISFNEVLPSMNDIFIETVKKSNETNLIL